MKEPSMKMNVRACLLAVLAGWGACLPDTVTNAQEELPPPLEFQPLDLSKVPIFHGRGPEMRALLESILDTEYCGDATMEGVTQEAALRGMAPLEDGRFVRLDEDDWPAVLAEMADEEFERLSEQGKLHSIADVGRLWNMIELLGTTRGESREILALFRKMAERATPNWDSVLFLSLGYAWINLTIEKEGAAKSLELGRILEASCGTDSMAFGIFLRQLGRGDAFGRCKTPEDLAVLSRFMMETAENCPNEDRARLIDSIAGGTAYFHQAKNNSEPFALGEPHMGVPGWKGSLQRKRLAERFKNEPARSSLYTMDPQTRKRIAHAPTQRDIDDMLWSRAAAELATEDSELTDLREVYGDWNGEEDNDN